MRIAAAMAVAMAVAIATASLAAAAQSAPKKVYRCEVNGKVTYTDEACKGATLSSDPATTVRELKQQDGKAIWLFGGGSLFKSLLDLGLVPIGTWVYGSFKSVQFSGGPANAVVACYYPQSGKNA